MTEASHERIPVNGNRQVSHHTDMEGIKMSEFGVNINSTAAAYVNTYSGTTKARSEEHTSELQSQR